LLGGLAIGKTGWHFIVWRCTLIRAIPASVDYSGTGDYAEIVTHKADLQILKCLQYPQAISAWNISTGIGYLATTDRDKKSILDEIGCCTAARITTLPQLFIINKRLKSPSQFKVIFADEPESFAAEQIDTLPASHQSTWDESRFK
jgi:hypothetical protein